LFNHPFETVMKIKNRNSIVGATENAGVDSRGGKCRSRLDVWKAEPRLYSETALS